MQSQTDHPAIANVPLGNMPPILAYNIVKPLKGCDVICRMERDRRSNVCRCRVRQRASARIYLVPRTTLGMQRRVLGRLSAVLVANAELVARR